MFNINIYTDIKTEIHKVLLGACMQHWYACQAEVAPRGVPMTAHVVFSFLIGAMHPHILQLLHTHHAIMV